MATKKSKRSASKKSTVSVKAKAAEEQKKKIDDETVDEATETKASKDDEVESATVDDKADDTIDDDTSADDDTDEADNADDDADDDDDETVEVIEVDEVEADDDNTVKTGAFAAKQTITDKLAALKPAALIAELLGTFVLTAIFLKLISNTNYGLLVIALVLAALTVIFGKISGAHLNPAVSIAAWINRRINGVKAVAYVVAQVLGAILAFFVLTGINNASITYETAIQTALTKDYNITASQVESAGGLEKFATSSGFSDVDAMAEQIGVSKSDKSTWKGEETYKVDSLTKNREWVTAVAALLGSIILGLGAAYAVSSKHKNNISGGLAMGLAFVAGLVIAGTTTVLNPAIAAAVGAFKWGDVATVLWPIVVYILAPVVGVTVGAAIYRLMAKSVDDDTTECGCKCNK